MELNSTFRSPIVFLNLDEREKTDLDKRNQHVLAIIINWNVRSTL